MRTYRIIDNLPPVLHLRQLTEELKAIDPHIVVQHNTAGTITTAAGVQELPKGFTVTIPDEGVTLESVRQVIANHAPAQTEEQEAAAADLAARVQRFADLLKLPAVRQALRDAISAG